MNNSGFTPTDNPSSLFPPLATESHSPENRLLWNVNTFGLHNESETSASPPNTEFPMYPPPQAPSTTENKQEDSTAFNISWGGDDKPPTELHPEKETPTLSRPLPKPRGIRRLPEPEPLEDGTIDEYTLKRRKVNLYSPNS